MLKQKNLKSIESLKCLHMELKHFQIYNSKYKPQILTLTRKINNFFFHSTISPYSLFSSLLFGTPAFFSTFLLLGFCSFFWFSLGWLICFRFWRFFRFLCFCWRRFLLLSRLWRWWWRRRSFLRFLNLVFKQR